MPVLHMVAGPNGSGKSMLYRYLLEPRFPALPFIEPQRYVSAKLQGLPEKDAAKVARLWADEYRQKLLKSSSSFVTETVMSHPSRLELIAQARSLGYEVTLYALCVDNPRTLLTRVEQRVREGGHSVPVHKIIDRYPRTLENLRRAARMADLVYLLDAVDASEGGPRLTTSITQGEMQMHTLVRPRWVDWIVGMP